MQSMTFQQFQTFPKYGYIFFFSMEGLCGLCKQYEKEIIPYNIPNLIKVSTENEDDFLSIGLGATPATRIYDTENKLYFEKYGVLYSKQVSELLEKFKSLK